MKMIFNCMGVEGFCGTEIISNLIFLIGCNRKQMHQFASKVSCVEFSSGVTYIPNWIRISGKILGIFCVTCRSVEEIFKFICQK